MTTLYKIGLSKQAIRIYQLLLSHGNLSATDIARHLDIAPTAVYRLIDHLISLGIITTNIARPTLYTAEDPLTARDRYVSRQQAWFTDSVIGGSTTLSSTNSTKQLAPTSFITGRDAMFSQLTLDYGSIKHTVNMIILGLSEGISPELLLAQKEAVARGVRYQIIVQEYSPKNKDTIQSWIRSGAEIRLMSPIGFHVIILDSEVAYLMMYDQINKYKRTAVRFSHPSIALQFQSIFDQYWQQASVINQ